MYISCKFWVYSFTADICYEILQIVEELLTPEPSSSGDADNDTITSEAFETELQLPKDTSIGIQVSPCTTNVRTQVKLKTSSKGEHNNCVVFF